LATVSVFPEKSSVAGLPAVGEAAGLSPGTLLLLFEHADVSMAAQTKTAKSRVHSFFMSLFSSLFFSLSQGLNRFYNSCGHSPNMQAD
jgi:hypothetical protein